MTVEISETRAKYIPPILEPQAVYVVLIGVSLPVRTTAFEGESE